MDFAISFPLSIFAASLRSLILPFVQDPKNTWSISSSISLTGFTLSTLFGHATWGSKSLTSMLKSVVDKKAKKK